MSKNEIEFSQNTKAKLQHKDLTERIIRAYYNVYNDLGYGFLEKCYERAMLIELESLGMSAQAQVPLKVYYKGNSIGDFYADIVVANTIIVELKSVMEIAKEHVSQLLNYLRSTEIEVGLLMNFGVEPKVYRRAFANEYKKSIHTQILHTATQKPTTTDQ